MSDVNSEPVGEAWKLDPEYHKVSDFLGVNVYDREDSELAKKIFALKDWAGAGEDKSLKNVLWKIHGLQKELGHNFIGKPLITEMYKTIRLYEDRQQSIKLQQLPQQPIKDQHVKPVKKVEKKEDVVTQSVNAVISKALGNKKVIQNAVLNAIKEAL